MLYIQIAAWDANLITAHRRMGNTGLSLRDLSDGKSLEIYHSLWKDFFVNIHVVLP